MKKHLFTLLVFLLSFSAIQAQEVAQLTLNESILYAIENNYVTKNARLETLVSKATVKETTAIGLPQITGNFSLDYNPKIPVIFLPNQPPFGDPNNPSDVIPARFGVSYSSALGVSVSQMIFDGSFFIGLRAAKCLLAMISGETPERSSPTLVSGPVYWRDSVTEIRQSNVTQLRTKREE
jgi:outer membrane protein TolC